jgi:lysophospholipase L1-like esterase
MFSCQLDYICWDARNFTVNLPRREVPLSDKLLGAIVFGVAGVHFNEAGAQQVADIIADYLLQHEPFTAK